MITEKDMQYVLTIANYGNLTKAANALFLSQPALSIHLKQLETSIGTPLFERRGRRMILTYAGEEFVKSAREITMKCFELEDRMQDIGKSCQELSLGQLCFLCSIPNNPTLYNPLKNFDNTVKRKNRILDQMLDDGVITKVDYDEAYQEEIKLNIQEVQKRDYIQTFVSYCAIRELMKKNGFEFKNSFADKEERETYETEYDDAYSTAQQMLLNKGYKIYTSFDLKKQKKLQKAVNHNLSGFPYASGGRTCY